MKALQTNVSTVRRQVSWKWFLKKPQAIGCVICEHGFYENLKCCSIFLSLKQIHKQKHRQYAGAYCCFYLTMVFHCSLFVVRITELGVMVNKIKNMKGRVFWKRKSYRQKTLVTIKMMNWKIMWLSFFWKWS